MAHTNEKAVSGGSGTAQDTAHVTDDTKNGDFITCLATFGPGLTKVYKSDSTVDSYDDAASFTTKAIDVTDLPSLSRLLTKLQNKPQHCIIRGRYVGDDKAEKGKVEGSIARTNVNFDDCPHHWLMIDIDKYEPGFAHPVNEPVEAIKDYLTEQLPPCFRDVSFHWQLSSSAGAPGKEHILKAHVWFWSETPYTSAQLYEWAKIVGPRIDKAVFRRVQIHYTAGPIFEEGITDPVPVRCGFYQGARDTVPLVIEQSLLDSARVTGSGESGNDMKLVDPSEKEGLIGLYHRTFDAHTVLMEHLEGAFTEGKNERRWTWERGGGAVEGVWVHDDQMHVHATHNTWPIDGIANLWDLVRVFKFGHLDPKEKAEEEFETMGQDRVGARPSDLAMKNWVAGLEEIKAAVAEEAEQEARARQSRLERYRADIKAVTDEYTIREKICPDISKDTELNASQREALAVEINIKLGQVAGAKPGVAAVRKMIRPERVTPIAEAKPEWLKGWCYVTDQDKFYRYDTEEWLSRQGFNVKHNRLVPQSDDGERIPADIYATELYRMETVVRGIYLPTAQPIFEISNMRCVNTYRPSSVPAATSKLDGNGHRAVKLVKQHLLALCNHREWLVDVILDWIAHNVQKPGVKIKYSPVIQGIEGDGKSLLGTLLAQVMGEPNVLVIAPEVVSKGDFNGWAEGGCVGVLEELRLQGNNRFDILNSVKPCVTNEQISVHRKNRDPYNAPNTMNYIAFTNHKDALPLDDTDRRWLVIFAPWDSIDQFAEAIGCAVDEYFDELHAAIYEHAAQLRRFFLNRDLTGFKRHGRAPDTDEKKVMVSLGVSDELATAKSLIAAGGLGFSDQVVSTRRLTGAIEGTGLLPPKSTAVNRMMLKLGFQQFPEPVKWDGETHRVWVRGAVTSKDHIRSLLNATHEREVAKDFED